MGMADDGSDLPHVCIALMMPLLRASTSSSDEMDGAVVMVRSSSLSLPRYCLRFECLSFELFCTVQAAVKIWREKIW